MPKKIGICIHHSLSFYGNKDLVKSWHTSPPRNWRYVGYHYICTNPYPNYSSWADQKPKPEWDGKIEAGRSPDTSHAAAVKEGNRNRHDIQICLIGNFDNTEPTPNQWKALVALCADLCKKHGIDPAAITYHRDWAINKATGKPYKSCPGNDFPAKSTLQGAVKRALTGQKEEDEEMKKVTVNLNGMKLPGLLDEEAGVTYVAVKPVFPAADYAWNAKKTLLTVKTK